MEKTSVQGCLTRLIQSLIEERQQLKAKGQNDGHVKRVITTIYGILGQTNNALYNNAIVQAICGLSRLVMETLLVVIKERHPRLTVIASYTDSCHITSLERITFAERFDLINALRNDLPNIVKSIENITEMSNRDRLSLKFEDDKFALVSIYSNGTNRYSKITANFNTVA